MTSLVLSNHMATVEDALHAAGHPVIVCMTTQHAALRNAANPRAMAQYQVITIGSWDAFDELTQLAYRLQGTVTRIATRWEGAMIAAGFLRDLLGLPGLTMSASVGFTDKAIMKLRLHGAGVAVAKNRVVKAVDEIAPAARELGGFPVVVKPRRGFASTNTHVVSDTRQLLEMSAEGVFDQPVDASPFYAGDPAFEPLARQPAGMLVEQYIDIAAEYHCDGLWIDGQPVYNLPGRYHTPPLKAMGGMLGAVLLDPDSDEGRRVAGLSARAAAALGMRDGFTHAEVLRTPDGRWLLGEIAARPGGGGIQTAIKHAYGVDVAAVQAALAAGEAPEVTLRRTPGFVGWAGPPVPPGRIAAIGSADDIREQAGVIDATVAAKPGQSGGRTGSGIWGGLAGLVYLRGRTPDGVLAMMPGATERFAVRVEQPTIVAGR